MKNFIILFIISFTNILAQVSIGFTIEGTGVITDKTSRVSPISGISFLLVVEPVQDFNLEAKIGYEPGIIDEYKGWDFSGYLNYDIKSPLYLIAGVSIHSNAPLSTNSRSTTSTNIMLIGGGAGIHIVHFLSFELLYHFPTTKEDWVYDLNYVNFMKLPSEKLTGVIKANLKFSWDL